MKKHAYLIMAHANWDLLEKIILQLDDENHDIYLHISSLSTDFDPARFEPIVKKSKLYMLPRIACTWAGFCLVRVHFEFLRAATPKEYFYYHVISGVDLPLHSNAYLQNFFDKHYPAEFIHLSRNVSRRVYMVTAYKQLLLRWVHKPVFFRLCYLGINTVYGGLQNLFGKNRVKKRLKDRPLKTGSSWWSITHGCAKYVLEHEAWVEEKFSDVQMCSDEIYLQTLLWQSPFRETLFTDHIYKEVYSYHARFIYWGDHPPLSGRPTPIRMAQLPYLLGVEELFARKFDPKIDSEVIDRVLTYAQNEQFTSSEKK